MTKMYFTLALVVSLVTNVVSQQETCTTPEDSFDVNSITKCTIKDSKDKSKKKTRQITVRVSGSKRFLKKREALKKQTGVGSLGVSGIQSTNHSVALSQDLAFKTNIENLKNKLSAEEVRNADKFSTVDDLPLFASCSDKKGDEQLECFNVEMIKHIQKYFNYPKDAIINKIEGEVWVRFIIDKDGGVTNIKALGPKGGKILKDEAIRVVANLPKFTPGKKRGKATSVKYGFPINFSLEDN